MDEDSTERQRIVEASELLGQLLLQDVERTEKGVGLKEGVSRDRIVSVHDPEMRHGHKSSSKRFPKEDFEIDLESGACTCPAGHTTRKLYRMGTWTDRTGRTHQLRAFWFDAAVCGPCPLKERCVGSGKSSGRTVRLHLQEAMLQRARALQKSEGYAEYR